jgi:hypothetical protein
VAVSAKHKFTNPKGDPADTTIVRPSNWNDEHALTMATGNVLGRTTAGIGAVEELPTSAAGAAMLAAADAPAQRTLLGLLAMALKASVGFVDMPNLTPPALIGRFTATAGAPEAISIGTGLTVSAAGVLSAAPPIPGQHSGKSIKVAGATTVTVIATLLVVSDGTSQKTIAIPSSTLTLATNGALNRLDAGAIAAGTWYEVWGVCKADSSLPGVMAVVAGGALALPTGYTHKGYMGQVRTIPGAATLYGTWQLGCRVQFVVGLNGTTLPLMDSGVRGNPAAPTWQAVAVSPFVPTTASEIGLVLRDTTGNSTLMAAPNGSYGSNSSTTNPPPFCFYLGSSAVNTNLPMSFLLEGPNVYWAGDGAGCQMFVSGWKEAQ